MPESIAHYKIISRIGAGGMEVYLAQDTKLDRPVALKVLLDEVAGQNLREQSSGTSLAARWPLARVHHQAAE